MRPGEGTTSRSWDLRWRGPRRWKLAALSLQPGQRPPHGSAPAAARLPDPGQDVTFPAARGCLPRKVSVTWRLWRSGWKDKALGLFGCGHCRLVLTIYVYF